LSSRCTIEFGTGGGQYWLTAAAPRNTALLMPSREIALLTQDMFDYLKIGFQLMQSSREICTFAADSVDFKEMEMLFPAVVDSREGIWKLRRKGGLAVPS
jgi:hypothetical protein